MQQVAALFVDPKGAYSEVPGVDVWGEERDARKYEGPWPVVAHPPCSRWCRIAGVVEARWGHKRGDDGGCFESALASVRRWGGVLEHPAYTDAWRAYGLPRPDPRGGWQATLCGGWVCHVEQGRYGHPARKATWLYAAGVEPRGLRWGQKAGGYGALVSWCLNRIGREDPRPRLSSKQASATPPEFMAELLALARSCPPAVPQDIPDGPGLGDEGHDA